MSHILEKDYIDETVALIEEFIDDQSSSVIMLESGHFNPEIGPSRFSHQSLNDALDLGSALIRLFPKRLRLVLGILVDDLGIPFATQPGACSGQHYSPCMLPEGIQQILRASHIVKLDRFLIASERNAKNRAIDQLKRLLDTGPEPDERMVVDRTDDDVRRLLLQQESQSNIHLATLNRHTATAHCPAIMGQHYADCFRTIQKRFPKAERLLIIDWSEMMDRWKVISGSKTCVDLLLPDTIEQPERGIINIFFGDDAGELYRLHEEQSRLHLH